MRDLLNNTEQDVLFPAKRYISAELGTAIDVKGEARKCLVLLNVGGTSTMTAAITVQERATSGASWTTLQALTADNVELQVVDLAPTGRNIRAICTMATEESGRTDIDFGLTAIFYNLRYIPENIT